MALNAPAIIPNAPPKPIKPIKTPSIPISAISDIALAITFNPIANNNKPAPVSIIPCVNSVLLQNIPITANIPPRPTRPVINCSQVNVDRSVNALAIIFKAIANNIKVPEHLTISPSIIDNSFIDPTNAPISTITPVKPLAI